MRFAEPVVIAIRCLLLLTATAWPVGGGAHEIRPTIATLEFTSNAELVLEISLNLEAAIAGIGAEHEDTSQSPAAAQYERLRALPAQMLETEFAHFTAKFLRGISLRADEELVPLKMASVNIPTIGDLALPRISQLTLTGTVPTGSTRLSWGLDPGLGNSVIRLREPGSGQILGAEFVASGERSATLSIAGQRPQSWRSVATSYLRLGFTHIVPKGPDHILFVVGLFLLSTRWRALIEQITAFTLAHTVTLAMGMIGAVQLSPAIVEPLIAASLIYVAIENVLTSRVHPWRLLVVFCFGLLHGLGFAAVLQQIGPAPGQFAVSLLAFNVGVELGQLTVVVVCFVALGWTIKRTWHRVAVVIPGSLLIAIVAIAWLVERVNLA